MPPPKMHLCGPVALGGLMFSGACLTSCGFRTRMLVDISGVLHGCAVTATKTWTVSLYQRARFGVEGQPVGLALFQVF